MKHTLGPLRVEFGKDRRDFIVADANGNTICETNVGLYASPESLPRAEAVANAYLFATAPEMHAWIVTARCALRYFAESAIEKTKRSELMEIIGKGDDILRRSQPKEKE